MFCNYLIGLALSVHINSTKNFNEIHPQGRMECGNYVSGIYLNSLEKPSIYAGFKNKFYNDLHVEYGIVDGYYGLGKKDIVPFLKLNYKNYFLTPTFDDDIAIVIGVEYFLGD